jgi:hypothetical protein
VLRHRDLGCGARGALAVVVEAAARLATEKAGVDQLLLDQRGREARIVVEGVPHRACDGEIDVVADHVHQLERPHAETAGVAHDRVECGAVATAFVEDAQRLGVVGTGDAVDDEARRRARMHRRLAPGRGGGEQGVGDGTRAVARPETISTSFISGAGLKKCRPARRSGRCRAAPIEVTEIDEVLVPKMQSAPTMSSRSRYSFCLASRFSTMASTTSAASASSASCSTAIRRARPPARLGAHLALVGELAELGTDAFDRLGGGARAVVEQLDHVAGRGRHLGDAGAHGAGADHGDDGRGGQRLRGGLGDLGVGHAHSPVNFGARFSMKAATPSA